MSKFLSRKFLISVAAFLASIGASICGLAIDNEIITAVGVVCSVLSSGLYAGIEAYCDVNCQNEDKPQS